MTSLALSFVSHSTEPSSVEESGIDAGLLQDLALKFLFYRGRLTRGELSHEIKLSGSVMEEVVQSLTQDGLATVLGAGSGGPSGYLYALTSKGLERAEAAIVRSGYVGPAPVALDDYIEQVRAQTVGASNVTPDDVARALESLVLPERTVARIGRAAAARKATLVYGESGNGKTTAVSAIGAILPGTIRIPYAITVAGQIVHLYDPSKHEIVEHDAAVNGVYAERSDRRWVRVRRPVICAGGELTRHSLEFVYDSDTHVYEAPLQLKANGGTLIIDDFGRQQIPAVQLLNRWISALEGGRDHLTLHTGQTIEVPFDVLVVFSTNLPPQNLADEAFLRRIRYKIEITSPTRDEYRTIFIEECRRHEIAYEDDAVTHLLERWYDLGGRELRGCHPRDLLDAIADDASYNGREAVLTSATLDEACSTYFLEREIAG